MAPAMTMNRVIHAAVRRDLARLDAALADFPAGDRARARDLTRAYGYLRSELTRHHEHADALIWPMLAGFGVATPLLETMESEHRAMADVLREGGEALDRLVAEPTAVVAAEVRRVVAASRDVVDQHLANEEREVEPLLSVHQDSPEWRAVEKQLRKAPPKVAGDFFTWLYDGIGAEERAYLRSSVAAPAVFLLTRLLGGGYRRDVAPVWHG